MSFLLLMELHSEWVQRLNIQERDDAEDSLGDDGTNCNHQTGTRNARGERRRRRRRKRIPFIVVANKLDLLEDRTTTGSCVSKRRSVMGLRGGNYNGKDFIYEYATDQQCRPLACGTATTIHDEESEGMRRHRPDRLTFSLKETLWSTDETYLTALQRTEDQLDANRLLILLWCERNGIPHVEASALDGRGVEEAMKLLIAAGIEELRSRDEEDGMDGMRDEIEFDDDGEDTTSGYGIVDGGRRKVLADSHSGIAPENNAGGIDDTYCTDLIDAGSVGNVPLDGVVGHVAAPVIDPSQYYFMYQPRVDKGLDLFARYSTKDEQKCSLFNCWLWLLWP
jgi:hypothetical protein